MTRARKVDGNHNAVLGDARAVGAEIFHTYMLGKALDALVGFRGILYWVEVKIPGCEHDLTPGEVETIERFRAVGCQVLVVTSGDELLKAIGATKG